MKHFSFLRRILSATLFGLSCHTAALHAQHIMFHLDAPQGIDTQTLAADIGKLQITFSNSNHFSNTRYYAADCLDLGSNYYEDGNADKDKYHKYYSCDLSLNADDGNGNAWWGNRQKAWLDAKTVSRMIGSTANCIYYRIYSPHFNRIITGQIELNSADEVTLHHTELAEARRVVFMPPVGRDGNAVPAILAPDLRTGTCNGFDRQVNLQDLTHPFARYANKGETLRYLVAPRSSELALHADSIVVTDTTTCVTTDYRKAVECRFYITDSQGQLCPVTNGQLASVYYKPQPNAKPGNGCHGYGCYNLGGNRFELTAPDGTHAAYVLPGQQAFQLHSPIVQTNDPDFLIPCNADGGYTIGEVTIPASTEPVSLSLAKSKPLRVTTTLTDAAPYADHLQFSAYIVVSPPYSWEEYKKSAVACKEVSRQIKGNDLVVTTLVECSTYPSFAISAQYGAQSDTIASVLNNSCGLYYYPDDSPTEFRLTQDDFRFDGAKLPPFSKLHPVKFIVPCHLLQQGERLYIHGQFGEDSYSQRCSAFATHHEGCAKSLKSGTTQPLPYDTLTVILPEGNYEWYVYKDEKLDPANNIHTFTLGATDILTQTIYDREFAMLRVSDLDHDTVFVYTNSTPATQLYQSYWLGKYRPNQIHYTIEEIPLHPGYNDYTVSYRQIKIQKDTLASVSYGIKAPEYEPDDDPYCNYYTGVYNSAALKELVKTNTATPDSAIMVSSRSEVNLIMRSNRNSWTPYYFERIAPSAVDTTVTAYTLPAVPTDFTYKGSWGKYYLSKLNMFLGSERTRVVPHNRFVERRSRLDLAPGHYTMSGYLFDDSDDTYIPFNVTFNIEANHPTTIELCPDPTAIAASPTNSASAKAAAYYTPDGRCISTPQPGLNIIKMTDGSVRKVMVK